MSVAEELAWKTLRALRDEGFRFVRQYKVGRYALDVASRKDRVAIEIDGGVHDLPGRREYDAVRQAHLENLGWGFIRIPAYRAHDDSHIRGVKAVCTPSSQEEGVRQTFPRARQRRTRTNRRQTS